jgi:UDP-N-acetylglucosamine 2-epimerase
MAQAGNPFGDGTASQQIVETLARSMVQAPVLLPALV